MRRMLLVAVLLVGVHGCGPGASQEAPAPSGALTNVSLHVEGMMCEESCAKSVQEILAALPGVEEATVNFEEQEAICQIDPQAFDADRAIAELADQDFVATVEE